MKTYKSKFKRCEKTAWPPGILLERSIYVHLLFISDFPKNKHDASIRGYKWLHFVCVTQCGGCQPSASEEADFKNRVEFLSVLDLCRDERIQMKQNIVRYLCLFYTVTVDTLKEQNLTQAASVHFLDSEGGLRCICRHDLILQILGTEDSPARAPLPIGSRLGSYKAPWISASIVLPAQTQNRSRLASEPEPHARAPRRALQAPPNLCRAKPYR